MSETSALLDTTSMFKKKTYMLALLSDEEKQKIL